MKRIELFEFEDFSWFPGVIRSGMTRLIVVLHKILGTTDVLATLISRIRKEHSFDQIVDIGSGSGGAMPMVIEKINTQAPGSPIRLLLTDLHPNRTIVEYFNKQERKDLKYSSQSLDATNFKDVPTGFKTMVNSFHHMPPDKAKSILKSAAENNEGILIYEIGENFVPTLLWWLLLPISLVILIVMSLFMTPFVRPISWKQLLFTYLIPIIPLCYAWDGQASTMRTYTSDDIAILLDGIEKEDYQWKIEAAKKENGKKLGYYILGLPKTSS